jgi:hypothetical protein
MTSTDLYQEIEINKEMDKTHLYKKLIESFPKNKIDFVMYNLFQYIYTETGECDKRKDQQTFRNELIERYGECLISGVSDEICEACHIIPHSKCEDKDKYNVNNGILLRNDLHKLFDCGLLKINPHNQQVLFDDKILLNPKMKCYHEYNNKIININKKSLPFLQKIENNIYVSTD